MIRSQVPAFSPASFREIILASIRAMSAPEERREALSSYLRARFRSEAAALTGSGTQALQLALLLGRQVSGGDGMVALPAFSCYDLVSAAVGSGSPVAFYDLDPQTLSPDLGSLRAALGRGARTVVVGNLHGYPLDWTGIRDLCLEAGATVVEDCAQGLGTTWDGSPGGTLGNMTVLSFGRGKGWTGGGGGALLVRGDEARSLTDGCVLASPSSRAGLKPAVLSLIQYFFGRPSLYWIPSSIPGSGLGETNYKAPLPPAGISTFSAALACLTAERARAEIPCRCRNADRLRELVGQRETSGALRVLQPLSGGEASYLRLPVLQVGASVRLEGSTLARSLGILRGYPRPLPDLPKAAELGPPHPKTEFPGARLLAENLVTFPTHSLLSERDFQAVRRLLQSLS